MFYVSFCICQLRSHRSGAAQEYPALQSAWVPIPPSWEDPSRNTLPSGVERKSNRGNPSTVRHSDINQELRGGFHRVRRSVSRCPRLESGAARYGFWGTERYRAFR